MLARISHGATIDSGGDRSTLTATDPARGLPSQSHQSGHVLTVRLVGHVPPATRAHVHRPGLDLPWTARTRAEDGKRGEMATRLTYWRRRLHCQAFSLTSLYSRQFFHPMFCILASYIFRLEKHSGTENRIRRRPVARIERIFDACKKLGEALDTSEYFARSA